jgi:tRNA (guanine-N7-)-methyltransferase
MAASVHAGDELAPRAAAGVPLPAAERLRLAVAAGGAWEVELGFGKGRYLLSRAAAEPSIRFLGIEVVAEFFEIAARRAARRELRNLVLLHGEALYALDALLPRGFARALHVYFPDPWPKQRHHKRRLFEPATVDLLLGPLEPGGRLFFASDHLDYAARVLEVLESHPRLRVERVEGLWPGGARTNYEAKYAREGRPILRLVATLEPGAGGREALLHPDGRRDLLVARQERRAAAEGGR